MASASLASSLMTPRPSQFVSAYNAESRRKSPHEFCGIFGIISAGGVRLALFQLRVQPRPGVGPPAIGRGRRDAEGRRSLGNRQAGEVAQLDQAGLEFIGLREPLQGLVDGQNVQRRLRGSDLDVVWVVAFQAAAVALALFAACLVDEDS